MFEDHPQTRLKRFDSLLCDTYVGLICFNQPNRRFNDTFTICVDESSVITQTCKTSHDGVSLCVFRCANETVKRVVNSCQCHNVCPLYSLPVWRLTSRGNHSLKTRRLIPHEKNFLQEFFSKNAKKVLRGIHAKLSSLAHFLLTRQPRFAKEKLFHHIHPYLSYLLDEILYH